MNLKINNPPAFCGNYKNDIMAYFFDNSSVHTDIEEYIRKKYNNIEYFCFFRKDIVP